MKARGLGRRPARIVAALLLLLPLLPLAAALGAEQTVGPSGLPLPRFVTIDVDRANVRTGPGEQYPIRFVLMRRDLPVEIVEEYDHWRRIRDPEGEEGWMHSRLLANGKRSVLVLGRIQELRSSPELDGRILLRAEPGVLGELGGCRSGWCEVEIAGRHGWMEGKGLWGMLPEELGD